MTPASSSQVTSVKAPQTPEYKCNSESKLVPALSVDIVTIPPLPVNLYHTFLEKLPQTLLPAGISSDALSIFWTPELYGNAEIKVAPEQASLASKVAKKIELVQILCAVPQFDLTQT